jgi:hypothetical protein
MFLRNVSLSTELYDVTARNTVISMFVDDEVGRIWRGMVVAYIKALSQYSPVGTGEGREILGRMVELYFHASHTPPIAVSACLCCHVLLCLVHIEPLTKVSRKMIKRISFLRI